MVAEKINQYIPKTGVTATVSSQNGRIILESESGEDIKLSPAARKLIPYSFECKNQEKLNIWDSLNQAEENSGDYDPVLIFKRNRSKTYAVVNVEKFIELINENSKSSK